MKLKDIENYLYTEYLKIIKDPVKISLSVAIFFSFIILFISKNDYNDNFLEGIKVEAHGMVFDLWIIGVFILFLNGIAKKHNDNQRYRDEIDDFRGWESEEAKYRIVGNIKRLNRNNATNVDTFESHIDLSKCYLKEAFLFKVNLAIANFEKANLEKANLAIANLERAGFMATNLKEANLLMANLKEADFFKANLEKAKLIGADLRGANFKYAIFKEANLKNANFQGAENLTIEQLSEVKTLYKVKLDSELIKQVKEKYPYLLEEPRQ